MSQIKFGQDSETTESICLIAEQKYFRLRGGLFCRGAVESLSAFSNLKMHTLLVFLGEILFSMGNNIWMRISLCSMLGDKL